METCPRDLESQPTVEPGGDGFGVPLEARSARQLLLLKPADYDFSGDGAQGPFPGPAETETMECGRVTREGAGAGQDPQITNILIKSNFPLYQQLPL